MWESFGRKAWQNRHHPLHELWRNGALPRWRWSCFTARGKQAISLADQLCSDAGAEKCNRGVVIQAGLYIVPSPREKRTQKKASCNFSSLRQPRYSSLSTNIPYFPARTADWELTGPCPHPSQIPKPQNAPCWSLGWKCKRSVIISPWAVTVRAAV